MCVHIITNIILYSDVRAVCLRPPATCCTTGYFSTVTVSAAAGIFIFIYIRYVLKYYYDRFDDRIVLLLLLVASIQQKKTENEVFFSFDFCPRTGALLAK